MSARAWALDLLYPIHTGEIGGVVGLWLATMTILGFWLWRLRYNV